MLFYLITFILLVILNFGYFKFADFFNIIDKPNSRSSHSYITIRGGGILFPAAVLLWFVQNGFSQLWLIFATLLIAGVSFLDDAITLSSKIRIIIQFIAVTLLFWQLNIFELSWYCIILVYLFTIGWINAFNFMDGINGITAFYGLVSLSSFAWLNRSLNFVSQDLIFFLIISVLIFSFFNARKRAKTFAGDVGSVSLAFVLAWFMISLIIKTGHVEYILFFVVYGIDSVFTIIFRLRKLENIFDAHRTHLYQFLSNELKWSHVLVSLIYCFIQIIINIITIILIYEERMILPVFITFILLLCSVYLFVRYKISKIIQLKTEINTSV
jgi:UDP-GlcNAc:undecaprenyl-phosphate/decaprenyl-phosphate GlcNAc-1-phosphate transferase